MKVTEHIENAKGKTMFSFEILPPVKGQHIDSIFSNIEPLMEFKPPFIDVTYHREEYYYKELENGLSEKRVVRKRPGTVGICAAIQNKFKVDAIPHMLCGGFTEEDTENFLIDLNFLGIDNVMALRGDAVSSETYFKPMAQGHSFASELVEQVVKMNNGDYLDDDMEDGSSTDFCIGVAGYPEKHMEAPSMEVDMHYLKKKVEKGADYIVTQMFFENKYYFDFVKKCRDVGITVPIIPGLKPLTSKKQLNTLAHRFSISLPDEFAIEVIKCKDNKAAREIGIEWCIKQSRELKAAGVPSLHYYSMGHASTVKRVARGVF